MVDKRIHEYIAEFEKKLNDSNVPDIQIVDDPAVGDGFRDLGFEMDCGHAFEEKYGDAFRNSDSLEKVLDGMESLGYDIELTYVKREA